MKYVVLLGDGMADWAVESLGGKTPLAHAKTPHMDRIAREGTLGLIDTVPTGMKPGSDVAILSVLGYDPAVCYTGRGPLVDEAALADALKGGVIAGAALDVFEHEPAVHPELVKLENVVLTPHTASATVESRSKMAVMAAENLIAGLAGERPQNLVNPQVCR